MGKAARNRAQRAQQKQAVRNELAKPATVKLVNKELNAQLADAQKRFFEDETAVILWVLHEVFGFGKIRLKRYFDAYSKMADELRDYYAVSDSDMPWLARMKLKEIGVDLDAWEQEENNRKGAGK